MRRELDSGHEDLRRFGKELGEGEELHKDVGGHDDRVVNLEIEMVRIKHDKILEFEEQ